MSTLWIILLGIPAIALAALLGFGQRTCRESQKGEMNMAFQMSAANVILVICLAAFDDEKMLGIIFIFYAAIMVFAIIQAIRLRCFSRLRAKLGI